MNSPTPARGLIVALFLLLTLVWGTTWAAIRVSLEGIPLFTGVAVRFSIASMALLAYAFAAGIRLGREPHERALWLANGLLSFCASYGVVYWAEQYIPSGLAAVLFAVFPLFVAPLAHLFLPGEQMTRGGLFGVLIGFAGLAIIYSEDLEKLGGPVVATASVVMLISPLVSAIANVAVKRYAGKIHPVSLSAVPMGMAGATMGVVALVVERDVPIRWELGPVAALLYLALAGSALTFSVYFWLLRHVSAVQLSMIAYSTPVVAVTVGIVFLGEPITSRILLGSGTVLLGVVFVATKGLRRVGSGPRP